MEIKQIIEKQVSLDEANGFPVKFDDSPALFNQLTKDLVGLFGEIGEFANIVKKINIKISNPENYEFDIDASKEMLTEELIDSFIYIIRIAVMLDIDLESEVIKKIELNANRYASLRNR
jgi:NTP pyrophosphatase (non-canonical NTP hydrolase)